MTYQKTLKDLAESGAISGYRRKSPLVAVAAVLFFAVILGTLIYGLYNASKIERAEMRACQAVNDPTCSLSR